MGKVKRNKSKAKKSNPAGLSVGDEELTAELVPNELSIQAAKEQLQASNLEDKLCGLQTLATLLESKEHAEILVQQSVIRVAAPLLLDDTPLVRNATAGTLRNFSTLGLDACDYLIEQDVMTPLLAFFHKYAENWTPKVTKAEKLDEDADTFLHSVHLLWNLCESSGTPIKYVNNSGILPILTRCLDRETFGNDIVATMLHCIFVIIEDNPQASSEVKATCDEVIKKIFFCEGSEPIELLLRILAAGIILNSHGENMKSLSSEIRFKIMSTLSASLSVDLRQECNKISSVLPLTDGDADPAKHKQSVDVQKQIGSLRHLIDAQQTAVEIMTNICSCEEQDDDYMETDDISDVDSEMDDEIPSNCPVTNGETSYSFDKLPIEIIESITMHGLVAQVWNKTLLPADNVMQILQDSDDGEHIYRRLCIIQSRALLCINNLMSNLPLDNLGGYKEIYKIWIEMGKLVFKKSESFNNEEILESATAVMRTALDRFKSNDKTLNGATANNDLFKELSVSDIQLMLEGINQCECIEIRANLTRMVGSLALILTQNSLANSMDILVAISQFILDRVFKETECWILAEIIDTVMDLFSEDETDALAAQINLVDKLNAIAPIFKTKVRQQRKSLGEHAPVISTVVTNLPRFIKYRKSRLANGS